MKQNVNGATAFIVIFVAIAIFFAIFSNQPGPENQQTVIPIPSTPEIREGELTDMFKGLSPLGIVSVMPPLLEDRKLGVRVSGVMPNSPAEQAGVQPADLIVQFDGKKLMSKDALIYLLNKVKADKTYSMVINRSGKILTVQVANIVPLAPEEQVRF